MNGDKNHEHIPSDTILLVDKHPVNYGSEKNPNHQEKRPLDSPGPTGPPDRARKGHGPRLRAYGPGPLAHGPTSGPLRAHGPTGPTGRAYGPPGLRAQSGHDMDGAREERITMTMMMMMVMMMMVMMMMSMMMMVMMMMMRMMMFRRSKIMMLRMMMLRRTADPTTGTHTLCEPAQSKCT